MEKAFGSFDANADGRLGDIELDGAVRVRSAVAGFLRGHRAELDADGDGGIERDESSRVRAPIAATTPTGTEPSPRPPARLTIAGSCGGRRGAILRSRPSSVARSGRRPARRHGLERRRVHGQRLRRDPALDRLADEGLVFDATCASAPNCAPTRACLMSGQWPGRHGVYTVVDQRNALGLPHHRLLAAESLRAAPEFVTFAEALGTPGTRPGSSHGTSASVRAARGPGVRDDRGAAGPELRQERVPGRERRQLPALTAEALRFIESHSEEPFLCYLALRPSTPSTPIRRLAEIRSACRSRR